MDQLGMDPNAPQMMMNPNAPPPSHLLLLQNFWQSQLQAIDQGELDFKTFQLPLARIKKVMKCDDDVKVEICRVLSLQIHLLPYIR